MSVLIGSGGNVVEGMLAGTTLVTAPDLGEASSSTSTSVFFPFLDLSINYEGTYKIRVDVYKVAYEDPNGATLYEQIDSNRIKISNDLVSRRKPCK